MQDISLKSLDGSPFPAVNLAGKAVLFVNVASYCGHTPQYTKLVELDAKYRGRGLVVLGVPCNQFGEQEPGSAEQIAEFCSMNYHVEFPLLEKQDVNGPARSPLYTWLVGSEAGGGADIKWNFEKFLVGKDGAVKARFRHRVQPDAPEVVEAIETALG